MEVLEFEKKKVLEKIGFGTGIMFGIYWIYSK